MNLKYNKPGNKEGEQFIQNDPLYYRTFIVTLDGFEPSTTCSAFIS
jgi:hypothetical protein